MTYNNNNNEIELEQSEILKREGIVTRYTYYPTNHHVEILLNHQYQQKTVVVSIGKNWNKVHDVLEDTLKRKDIKPEHRKLLRDVIDDNHHVIISQGSDSGLDDQENTENIAQMVLRLAEEQTTDYFLDQFGTPYAAVEIDNHIETMPIWSSRFKSWLCRIYYNERQNALGGETTNNVCNVLAARAQFDTASDTKNLSLRVATVSSEPFTIYYDLTNRHWEVVKITPEGWSVVSSQEAPILFRRYKNQIPQAYPKYPNEYPPDIFDQFIKLINISKGKTLEGVQAAEDTKLLLKCYIVSLFFVEVSKAILMGHGEQGAAKTRSQELIKQLVDPSQLKTLTFPKDLNELIQELSHNYVAYFDNVSHIPDWISDELCRGTTGTGFSKRQLYTDDDDIIYNFKRCIGFNGINLGATKADLLDRGLIYQLERIPKQERKLDEDIWAEFERIRPLLLAYIFDILVKVLKVKQNGGIKLDELPRMADFAITCEIISRCMGNPDNAFIEAFNKNIEVQITEAIASNPIANVIIKFVEMQSGESWEGSATDLHNQIEEIAETLKLNIRQKAWPKSASSLSRRLNEVKTNLREVGITIESYTIDLHKKTKGIKISKMPSAPSASPADKNQARIARDITSDTAGDTSNVDNKGSAENKNNNENENENEISQPLNDSVEEQSSTFYQCYYCNGYRNSDERRYTMHVINTHGRPAFPNKAEIEKQGLKPQGKDWEI